MPSSIVSKLIGLLSFGLYHFREDVPMANGVKRCRSDCWCDGYNNRIAERNYEYILDDWKKYVKNTSTRKPKRALTVACMQTSVRYSDKKRELQRMVDHIKEHPREPHWHIPVKIRANDFLDFVHNASDDLLKKLKYKYEADPR